MPGEPGPQRLQPRPLSAFGSRSIARMSWAIGQPQLTQGCPLLEGTATVRAGNAGIKAVGCSKIARTVEGYQRAPPWAVGTACSERTRAIAVKPSPRLRAATMRSTTSCGLRGRPRRTPAACFAARASRVRWEMMRRSHCIPASKPKPSVAAGNSSRRQQGQRRRGRFTIKPWPRQALSVQDHVTDGSHFQAESCLLPAATVVAAVTGRRVSQL